MTHLMFVGCIGHHENPCTMTTLKLKVRMILYYVIIQVFLCMVHFLTYSAGKLCTLFWICLIPWVTKTKFPFDAFPVGLLALSMGSAPVGFGGGLVMSSACSHVILLISSGLVTPLSLELKSTSCTMTITRFIVIYQTAMFRWTRRVVESVNNLLLFFRSHNSS